MFLSAVRKTPLALRFLGGLTAVVVLLVLLVLRVTGWPPAPPPQQTAELRKPAPITAPEPRPAPMSHEACFNTPGWGRAAKINTESLRSLRWAPFGRPEKGWEVYVPLIQREVGTSCAPTTAGFAAAFAKWQGDQRLLPDGVISEKDFLRMKGVMQTRRAFVRLSAQGVCPKAANEVQLTGGQPGEGYSGKYVQLRHKAFHAYREMVETARREDPRIALDPRYLTIFSAFRSPGYDAARCARDGNCNGIVRARCSPHRTGLAMDLYVGQAPGFGPDSSADANRRYMVRTPAYQWLVANGHRFGFVNYPFEPWHWEWTGETP